MAVFIRLWMEIIEHLDSCHELEFLSCNVLIGKREKGGIFNWMRVLVCYCTFNISCMWILV